MIVVLLAPPTVPSSQVLTVFMRVSASSRVVKASGPIWVTTVLSAGLGRRVRRDVILVGHRGAGECDEQGAQEESFANHGCLLGVLLGESGRLDDSRREQCTAPTQYGTRRPSNGMRASCRR